MQSVKQHKIGLTASIAIALVVLVAAGYGVFSMFRRKADVPFENYKIMQITDNGKSIAVAISADGKYVLSEMLEGGKASIWLRHIATNSDTQIIAPADAYYRNFDFSPDGNYFYFRKARSAARNAWDVYRAPALGGNAQIVVRDVDSNIAVSPNGKYIAYERFNNPEVGKYQLLEAGSDGSDEKTIASGPEVAGRQYVSWSPNGKQLALVSRGGLATQIQLVDLSSGKTQELPKTSGIGYIRTVWAPDGRGLFVQYEDIAADYHEQLGFVPYPSGHFRTITKDTASYSGVALSADGKTLATVQDKEFYTFFVIPATGTGTNLPVPTIAQQQKGFMHFAWLTSQELALLEDNRLVKASVDGSRKTTLLSNSSIYHVDACPDGRTILMTLTGRDGAENPNVWQIDADGSNLKRLSKGLRDYGTVCSRDSKWVYWANHESNRVERVPLEGGTPETVPGSIVPQGIITSRYLDISPDGKSLTFLVDVHEANWTPKIALVPLDGGAQPRVRYLDPNPAISEGPRFTPDGKALVYSITQNGVDNLWIQPLDGSPGRLITNFKSGLLVAFRWSPDGKSIGVLADRSETDVVLLHDTGVSSQ